MNREKYVMQVKTRNSYCSCSDLSRLFEKSKKAELLERKCNSLKANINLKNPNTEDRKSLENYKETYEDFEKTVGDYHIEIRKKVKEDKLKLILHDKKEFKPLKQISLEETIVLKEQEPIITVNCFNCNQQIDLIDYL
tara:strand:- start:594 stop:1007 length:414 start_codon:yes stop_codon:yes gene_type:complete